MEFFQRNQTTILVVLAVLAVLFFLNRMNVFSVDMPEIDLPEIDLPDIEMPEFQMPNLCPGMSNEGYQADHTVGGRGPPGRGLQAHKIIPTGCCNQENNYMK